jgi:hypothetical protein
LARNPDGITDVADYVLASAAVAGGFMALAALCAIPHTFFTSLFGINDLIRHNWGTRRFVDNLVDKMLGGSSASVPGIDMRRSSVNNAHDTRKPLLVRPVSCISALLFKLTPTPSFVQILQGLEDLVMPPEQADLIVSKIHEQGSHVKDLRLEGEGRGWCKDETIKTAFETEPLFCKKVLKIAV